MPPGTVAGHVQDFTVEEFGRLIEQAKLRLVERRTVAVFEFYLVSGAD
jgi:hypothetical protein